MDIFITEMKIQQTTFEIGIYYGSNRYAGELKQI